MLRSQRSISEIQAAHVKRADDSGIAPKASMELMAKAAGGREKVGLTSMDLKNYLHSYLTRKMEKGEAGDGQMIVGYGHFGDVICFDTTYRTNNENRPFAMFVGVNNYMQSINSSVALLYDETAKTFEWLFKSFIKTMGGKQPKTILTDDDATMAKTINLTFSKDFSNCVYDYEDVNEFEDAWEKMIKRYKLQENDWLQKLYDKRHKWALVFGQQTFSAANRAAHSKNAYKIVMETAEKILKEVTECLKHTTFDQSSISLEDMEAEINDNSSSPSLHVDKICGDIDGKNVNFAEEGTSTIVKGIKHKMTNVRSSKRPKNALEKAIAKRTKRKKNHIAEESSTEQPIQVRA
ncbi:PREDICTED: protein FAR1-RELATED SEQUENCE 5-like [Nelumbo nucifera]|uniref:Protein FAR1-RELATED SEQUENCE 5-like n=1 Tax=Nelumbo nucifera TaxID=4432 RepID=A0A1U8ASB7_NELNU|nr:PREDICTED: protein FAR1-RELATED SEQUENCE 5-like [Nelumbo nucifera]